MHGPFRPDMRQVVALVPITREQAKGSGFWKSRIRPLALTAEGTSAADADAKLLRMFWTLINTYRSRHGEDGLAKMLSGAGIRWSWKDEYAGKRAPLETGPDVELPSRARPRAAVNPRPRPLAA